MENQKGRARAVRTTLRTFRILGYNLVSFLAAHQEYRANAWTRDTLYRHTYTDTYGQREKKIDAREAGASCKRRAYFQRELSRIVQYARLLLVIQCTQGMIHAREHTNIRICIHTHTHIHTRRGFKDAIAGGRGGVGRSRARFDQLFLFSPRRSIDRRSSLPPPCTIDLSLKPFPHANRTNLFPSFLPRDRAFTKKWPDKNRLFCLEIDPRLR